MPPTILALEGGARAYVDMPPRRVRAAIASAPRRGRNAARLGDRYIALRRIRAVDGVALSPTNDDAQAA